MRHCPRCERAFPATHAGWRCDHCGFAPRTSHGAPLLAAEHPGSETGYEARFFAQLFEAEPRSFWFRSRNQLIAHLLQTVTPPSRVLELGCGTGFVSKQLARTFPSAALTATDLLPEAFPHACQRVPHAELLQLDIRALPFTAEFDLACAFDVIEHVAEDDRALAEVHRALRPRGWFLLTVPQHRALWSASDDLAHHQRRYARGELTAKLRRAGFEVVRQTSFVTLLLPLLVLARKLETRAEVSRALRLPRALDSALAAVMAVERLLISTGLDLPIGGSSIVLARRR